MDVAAAGLHVMPFPLFREWYNNSVLQHRLIRVAVVRCEWGKIFVQF